jgi:hypothetical protein
MLQHLNKRKIYQSDKRAGLSLLAVLICCSLAAPAQTTIHTEDTGQVFSIRSTHLLGFENARNNCAGTLTIKRDLLQFQQNNETPAQVKIGSVRDVFLGEESKQVGGLPMTLGKAAAPFGSGRVVSLVAHKKYDTLTLEYVDDAGGIHGAIFELQKGQAEAVKGELITHGAIILSHQDQATERNAEVSHENK